MCSSILGDVYDIMTDTHVTVTGIALQFADTNFAARQVPATGKTGKVILPHQYGPFATMRIALTMSTRTIRQQRDASTTVPVLPVSPCIR